MIEKLTQDFSKYIQKRFGIVTDAQSNKQLEKFVTENIRLLVYPNWQSELNKRDLSDLVNGITITETYFFRDRKQLNVMIDNIKMKLKESKNKINFNIWSMGCSSGEEPYTISLMLKELQNYESFDYQVKGFDINTKNIEKAQKGVYTSWSFRGTEKNFLIQKYFKEEENNNFSIKDSVKENVSFKLFNITEDLFDPKIVSKYGIPDYIFLRNTIMYFDRETVAKIVSKMYELLSDGGMLIPGIQEVRIF
ncbi:MAG: CheR family methyltransferase, partial [Candidatus Sericytochromatia bacterium]